MALATAASTSAPTTASWSAGTVAAAMALAAASSDWMAAPWVRSAGRVGTREIPGAQQTVPGREAAAQRRAGQVWEVLGSQAQHTPGPDCQLAGPWHTPQHTQLTDDGLHRGGVGGQQAAAPTAAHDLAGQRLEQRLAGRGQVGAVLGEQLGGHKGQLGHLYLTAVHLLACVIAGLRCLRAHQGMGQGGA